MRRECAGGDKSTGTGGVKGTTTVGTKATKAVGITVAKAMPRKKPRFAVIGAGMAGILSAIKLKELGCTNYAIYEKAGRLGGTWRENTYPGVACDVPAHLYSYSFAPNPDWSHVFAGGNELQCYFEDIAQRYGVASEVRYGTEIDRLEWAGGKWHLHASNGVAGEADVVIAATGVLHHPAYPDIEGLGTFHGPAFHTARWNHSIPIKGSRIAVIGTGSSAVQVVSELVHQGADTFVFQRTPQWILAFDNTPYTEEERSTYRSQPAVMAAMRDQIRDTFEKNFANAVVDANSPEVKVLEELCRTNLETHVQDPVLREHLRPAYRAACKRLILSPYFYDAIQQDNAHLVTERIACVEPAGIRTADGTLHEVDAIVLATGFRVDQFIRPAEVIGRNGIKLNDLWAKRPAAYMALSVPDMPNLFLLNGPNGPVGNFSLIDVAELQFSYVMQALDPIVNGPYREVSAKREAHDRFEADRVEASKKTIWVTGCKSWYLDDRGIPAVWPWNFDHFRESMAKPLMEDYELVAG